MIIVLLDNCWLQGNDKNKSKNGGKECLREQTYQSSIVQELSFLCPLLLVCPCVFVSPINCRGWLRAVVSVFIFITFYPIMGRSWCVVSVVEKQLQRWFVQELKTYVGENNAIAEDHPLYGNTMINIQVCYPIWCDFVYSTYPLQSLLCLLSASLITHIWHVLLWLLRYITIKVAWP